MTAFTFNVAVPATNNDPSVDQPDMLTNNISNNAIWAVDHITFNSSGSGGAGASGGQHLQVTFNNKAAPGAMVDPLSIAYTFDGVANTVHPQLYYKNSQAVVPLSSMRAFGSFLTSLGTASVTLINSFNVSFTSHAGNIFVFTLTTGSIDTALNTAFVIPFFNAGNTLATISYTLVGNTLTLNVSPPSVDVLVNFIVIQI